MWIRVKNGDNEIEIEGNENLIGEIMDKYFPSLKKETARIGFKNSGK